jgi:hypothetical protein
LLSKFTKNIWLDKKEKQQIQTLKNTTFDFLAGKTLNENTQR